MTNEEINIAIAESLGWDVAFDTLCNITPDHNGEPVIEPIEPLPNYTSDLNACREFEKTLTDSQWFEYERHIKDIALRDCKDGIGLYRRLIDLTARQRCEAYLRTTWRWKE